MPDYHIAGSGLGFVEGPVWTSDGRLLVTSISHGVVYELGADDARVLADTSGGPNGMTEGKDGTLYVAQNGGIFGTSGRSERSAQPGIQVIEGEGARHIAKGLGAPNDLCFGPDGRLYFTDPRGWARPTELEPGRVYAMAVDGEPELLAEGPAFTNGIAFGPDAARLYVAETFGSRVLVYPVRKGALGQPREFCRTEPGMPDGLAFDQQGRLYVAATTSEQVQVFNAKGACVDRLHCGDGALVTNVCFGGPEGSTLFATDARNERVLAFDAPVAGMALYPFRSRSAGSTSRP